jgi:hypothetical protein
MKTAKDLKLNDSVWFWNWYDNSISELKIIRLQILKYEKDDPSSYVLELELSTENTFTVRSDESVFKRYYSPIDFYYLNYDDASNKAANSIDADIDRLKNKKKELLSALPSVKNSAIL